MRETLRRVVARSVGAGLLVTLLLVAFIALDGQLAGMTGFFIVALQPLQVLAWNTILDLNWWASFGALLAAFVIAHRRGATPEASGDEGEAAR